MTVRELIDKLRRMPQDLDVTVDAMGRVEGVLDVKEENYGTNVLGEDSYVHHHYVTILLDVEERL